MKKAIKSVVSMVLVFVMVFSVFTILPSEVFHSWYAKAAETLSEITGTEETYVSGDYTYTLVDEYTKVKITSYSGEDETLAIPEQIDGKDVSIIGDSVFYNKTFIKTVTIPDTVTTIGNSAFNSCTSMTEVTFGKSVKTIGDSAFNSCTSLKSVKLPDSVESIGSWAFYNDDAIT
ncbi:MAG: leucine-rich repeat domain-containing protein, partial [Ruminococcus bromii]|nr:leucine-rich repeat domain-containing protein [Ruminococcus bromii]